MPCRSGEPGGGGRGLRRLAQPGIVGARHVGKPQADRGVVRAGQRVGAGEVQVILDQRHVARAELRIERASGVGHDQRVAPRRGRRQTASAISRASSPRKDGTSLHQHARRRELAKENRPAWPGRSKAGAGDLGIGDRVTASTARGEPAEARAEDDRLIGRRPGAARPPRPGGADALAGDGSSARALAAIAGTSASTSARVSARPSRVSSPSAHDLRPPTNTWRTSDLAQENDQVRQGRRAAPHVGDAGRSGSCRPICRSRASRGCRRRRAPRRRPG